MGDQEHTPAYNFFFADAYRIAIMILIIIAIILFFLVIAKSFTKQRKFKLMYIVMLNVIFTAIINAVGFLFNWVIYGDKEKNLLFGETCCKIQSFILFFFHAARESFVTLISVVSFISFKFDEQFNNNKNKLGLIMVFLFGYLIPIITNIIYLSIGAYDQGHYFCFVNNKNPTSKVCGFIHTFYVIFLVIVSIILISYLVIKTANCNKEQNNNSWTDDDVEKHCINPNLKKIIFFPIAQFCFNVVLLIYRIKYLLDDDEKNEGSVEEGVAAVLSSLSSISYSIIFAITNGIFTNTNESSKNEIIDSPGLIEM